VQTEMQMETSLPLPIAHQPTNRAEETRLAIEHLDVSFMRRFTKLMFNPTNPFIAGASVLGSIVAAQTAYMQGTYEPLPHPKKDRSFGIEYYEGEQRHSSMKRIIVLGDSLVVGVGCNAAPVISQSLARGFAQRFKSNVAWRSFGIDGGDARTIHQSTIESVRSLVRGSREHTNNGHSSSRETGPSGRTNGANSMGMTIDACVIICGLNDFKKLWKGRTAMIFQRDLENFVMDLRECLGPDCLIVLPALPMEPTRFPEPLRSFVILISEVFDEQKKSLCSENPHTLYVQKPSVRWWRRVHERFGGVMSGDGVHPNETGYQVFGEWLGGVVARRFKEMARSAGGSM